MTFPKMNTRDYVTNDEVSHPIATPQTVWVVYYLDDDNEWTWSLPSFYKINAERIAAIYASSGRQVHILQYVLNNEWKIDKPVQKIVKKIRKVRQVKQITTGEN